VLEVGNSSRNGTTKKLLEAWRIEKLSTTTRPEHVNAFQIRLKLFERLQSELE
jgi:hypothetical protein